MRPQFGCSVSRLSPVRDCPAGRSMYLRRSIAAASTTKLQAALRTVVTAAPQLFSCDHTLCRSGKICPMRAGDSLSALAVMKGVDAYDLLIGFHRKREANPTKKKGEL